LRIDIVQLSVQLNVLVKGKVNWSGPIFLDHHSLYHPLRSFGLGRAVQALVKAYYKAKGPPCFVVNGLSGDISKPEIGLQQALHLAQLQSLRSWYLAAQQGTTRLDWLGEHRQISAGYKSWFNISVIIIFKNIFI
jgi:hypothetical protein